MKRMILYITVLAAVWFAPVEAANIGSLHPVEVVVIYEEEGEVVLETDTGDLGKGTDSVTALEDLKKTTPGIIYLDTAEYLLIGEEMEDAVEELRPYLKKNIKLCKAEKGMDLTETAAYLTVHGKMPQLGKWKKGDVLPYLTIEEKRLKLS